ncbi:MAG: hypothetical protein JKY12_01600 [Sneathiella sp.]|nr:hypothetical protein [Sneathiella sp.]
MTELLANTSMFELLVRMIATALIVVLVATAVGKLGPLIGGLVAGLPIGLGPGFYFLIGSSSTDFLVQTATFSLLTLSATQIFLTTYIVTARRDFPIASLLTAVVVWVIAITVLNGFPVTTISAAALFVVMTVATYLIGQRFQMPKSKNERKEGFRMLLLRACIAGLLVALVTTSAQALGAELSGILLAFPIGYALISVTVHEQYGTASVIGVLHSALLGTISLATFCVAFAVFLQNFSAISAFFFGLTASLSITSLMVLSSLVRWRRAKQEL